MTASKRYLVMVITKSDGSSVAELLLGEGSEWHEVIRSTSTFYVAMT
jgi:GDP-D-mannose dehydratase